MKVFMQPCTYAGSNLLKAFETHDCGGGIDLAAAREVSERKNGEWVW